MQNVSIFITKTNKQIKMMFSHSCYAKECREPLDTGTEQCTAVQPSVLARDHWTRPDPCRLSTATVNCLGKTSSGVEISKLTNESAGLIGTDQWKCFISWDWPIRGLEMIETNISIILHLELAPAMLASGFNVSQMLHSPGSEALTIVHFHLCIMINSWSSIKLSRHLDGCHCLELSR